MKKQFLVVALLALVVLSTGVSALDIPKNVVDDSKPWWQRSNVAAAGKSPIGAKNLTSGHVIVNNKRDLNQACIQAAVVTRDNAMIAAEQKLFASLQDALEARRDSQVKAWAEPSERKQRKVSLDLTWQQYRSVQQSAMAAFKVDRERAWDQWSDDMYKCDASPSDDNTGWPADKIIEAD